MWITWQSTSRACTVSTASTALPVFETIIQQRSHAMRAHMLCTIVTLLSSAAFTQQPAAQNPPPAAKLYASSADVTAMIAKARSERKPDQANYAQPIVRQAPYTANLEYRVSGVAAPASVHEREAEMFYVVEASGTLVTGGTL